MTSENNFNNKELDRMQAGSTMFDNNNNMPTFDAEGKDGTEPSKARLACLACRSKKAKCSGEKPRCSQCTKSNLNCIWPDGRRRKRTKKEMEEDLGAHYGNRGGAGGGGEGGSGVRRVQGSGGLKGKTGVGGAGQGNGNGIGNGIGKEGGKVSGSSSSESPMDDDLIGNGIGGNGGNASSHFHQTTTSSSNFSGMAPRPIQPSSQTGRSTVGNGNGNGMQDGDESNRFSKQSRTIGQDYLHQFLDNPFASSSSSSQNRSGSSGHGNTTLLSAMQDSSNSSLDQNNNDHNNNPFGLPFPSNNSNSNNFQDLSSSTSNLTSQTQIPGFSAPIGQYSAPIADSPRTNALVSELLRQYNLDLSMGPFSGMGSPSGQGVGAGGAGGDGGGGGEGGMFGNGNGQGGSGSMDISSYDGGNPFSGMDNDNSNQNQNQNQTLQNRNHADAMDAINTMGSSSSSTLTKNKEKQEQALMKAVTDQVGFVSVDDSESEPYLRVYYFRASGTTSIHPGINRICLKLRLKPPEQSSSSSSALTTSLPRRGTSYQTEATYPAASPSSGPAVFGDLQFDTLTDLPPANVYTPLLELFFELLEQHFPSIQKTRIYNRLADGTMSALLLNSMCALAARFSDQAKGNKANAGNAFMDKACNLLISALRLPNTDAVTSLLLMAQCEFGQNNESGAWHFTGLAIRMAEEIGFQKNDDQMYEDAGHFRRNKLLFWSIFVADRLLSLHSGRPCTLREEIIEIPLPDDEDLVPAPLPPGGHFPVVPEPFSRLVRLMVICGRISDLLNGSRGAPRTFGSAPPADLAERVESLQQELSDYYKNLPDSLMWSASNFKSWIMRNKGGIFLTLHCVANAVLALLFHPAILSPNGGTETPMSRVANRSIKQSLISARLVADTIVFADLASPLSMMASPQIVQAIYVAGLAFVYEVQRSKFGFEPVEATSTGSNQDTLLQIVAEQNLNVLINALKRLESVWGGAGVPRYVLTQRAQGIGHSKIDFERSSESIPTFVSVPDTGVLKRFTGDVGSDDASPASHIANVIAGQSPTAQLGGIPGGVSLETLLARYAVDDLQVESGFCDPAMFPFGSLQDYAMSGFDTKRG